MLKIISVDFFYKQIHYKALIRRKENGTRKEYHITVMNGDLEKLLYGNHIFIEENGRLKTETVASGNEITGLKAAITDAFVNLPENKAFLNIALQ